MRSHRCEFSPRDILRMAGGPLLGLLAFAAAAHLAARAGWLPRPRPTLDTDRTILIHQADASRQRDPAQVLLLGDSSCLMGISATRLAVELGQPVLNLATLSYLDVAAHGRLLREFTRANPDRKLTLVLLMHPEALRRIESEPHHWSALTNYLAGTDDHRFTTLDRRISAWLGVDIVRGRLLARLMPTPLAGTFGRTYGFSTTMEEFMTASRGSLVELESVPLTGSSEYRLAPTLRLAAAEFRQAVPATARLVVGLTPVAEGMAGQDFAATHRELLREWGKWLAADALLESLPATWPDEKFARSTHLRPAAVPAFTTALAQALQDLPPEK